MQREILNLDITLGPLHYRLQAHDDWATSLLGRIADRFVCVSFNGLAHRQVHIVRQMVSAEAIESGELPRELASLVPQELPSVGWQVTGNDTLHLTWRHNDTPHAFWSNSCHTDVAPLPFNLPLDLLFHDIVQRGGAIAHGGLAVYQEQGVLLTAPPGGGKTTAFSTTPQNWQLASDDASLVWPGTDGSFHICALPTWSVLLGVNPQLERIGQWQIGTDYPLKMVLFLEKAEKVELVNQRPLDATYPLYRAFSEYPTVIISRVPYRVALFRVAAALARDVPAWSLLLPRKGNFWPLLEEQLEIRCD